MIGFVCPLAVNTATALAETLCVPDQYPTIQSAIDASTNGDEVVVAPGTYLETINFNGKAIIVRSSGGPKVTTIDATGLNDSVVKCVSGEGPSTVLEGFTITGGTGIDPGDGLPRGGGMYNSGTSPTVTNCRFSGNTASSLGGGMYNSVSSPTVTNCIFSDNTADSGDGGGMYSTSPTPTLTNCTFSGNTAAGIGGGIREVYRMTNCILWGDSPDEIVAAGTVTYSDVQGGFAGEGNIDADPMFVDAGDDLRLSAGSPAVDAGNTPAYAGPLVGIGGNPR
ncbi:MAG: right-handed parallel beta-helix repeat-containing protein, partial [Planctomycetes bacterium]|nr:right-handed parallel beta-helix repeat-containing protein [Planctomycetota bacterium]